MTLPQDNPAPDTGKKRSIEAPEDLEMIRLARSGDEAARHQLGTKLLCVPRMVAAINSRRGAPLDIETQRDVAQDALMTIWKKIESFTGEGPIERWAYQFCQYEFLNQVRRRARRNDTARLDDLEPATVDPDPQIDQTYSVVSAAIEELGHPESTITRLRHDDGLSFEEIGPLVDLLPNTAKTRYYRGLTRLRRRLACLLGDQLP